ncbi:MAG TPA: pentapeptide repeat-containing protein, partial [Acidobacteriota bacterium]
MANSEHLRLLPTPAWNSWRQSNPSVTPDFVGADLAGWDLSGKDLHRSHLSNANLMNEDF